MTRKDDVQKLSQQDWAMLDNMMQNVPDPNTTFTATGWHYQLAQLLSQMGYRPVGRHGAYDLAMKLWEAGPYYENS
jgi:hypothetical protein